MSKIFAVFFISVFVFGLSSCATTPPSQPTTSTRDPVTPAKTATERQLYLDMARNYIKLSSKSKAPQKQDYQLRAANILALGNFTSHARQILGAIPEQELDNRQHTRKRLLNGYIAILEHNPKETLQLLKKPLPPTASTERKVDYHRLRATAFGMENRHLHSARERVALEPLLTRRNAINKNRQAIWQSLSRADKLTLEKIKTLPPPHVLSGWIELMQISKSIRYNSQKMRKHLEQWQANFSDHPAGEDILAALYEQSEQVISLHPENIALLLPLSGNLQPAGEAIQNGFISAYYAQEQEDGQQQVRIYDVNSATDIREVYQRAITDGSDLVVGPLDKNDIATLVNSDTLTVPTLALNYLDQDGENFPDHLFQLGLSPEDEARQAARRIWADGHSRIGIVYPDTSWGQRVADAFIYEWEKSDSSIVAAQSYDNSGNDFSSPISQMLKIAESNTPAIELKEISEPIDKNPATKPPLGVDAVFMPGSPRQLRQLRPQLRFHDAGEIPVYATSQAFTGKRNRIMDRDLNGILFCDMPWILDTDNGNRKLRQTIRKNFAIAPDSQINRLYALGVDAYNVIKALASLQNQPYERYDGETGMLMMDDNGRLHRQLPWAIFERGTPRILFPSAATSPEE